MKRHAAVLLFPFLLLLTINSASSQPGTGSTVINTTVNEIRTLNITLTYPYIVIPEDYYFYENLTVFQTDTGGIYVYLNKTDTNGFVKFVNFSQGQSYYQDDYTLLLPPNTSKNVTLRVYVSPNQGYDGGTYNVQMHAESLNDSRSDSETLQIHVNTTNPIDDIEITGTQPPSLYPGETFAADISMHKMFPTETTDMQICYCVDETPTYPCGPSYNNYGCSWKAVTDWLNYTQTITMNENPGEYYFIVSVSYPNTQDVKRANSPKFLVMSVPSGPTGPTGPGMPPYTGPIARLEIRAPEFIESAPGDMVSFEVGVKNTGAYTAFNTTLKLYGIPENWASITPSKEDIDVSKSKNYSVSISLPPTAFEQVYSLSLVAKSGSTEATKPITMTVAMTREAEARFLLGEAESKKNEAYKIINDSRRFGINVDEPEMVCKENDAILDDSERLYAARLYADSIERSKEAIDGYRLVIGTVKGMVEKAYFSLLDKINGELVTLGAVEEDVVESIRTRVNESIVLQKEGRIIEAYETLLYADQLLDQLRGKIFFSWLINTIIFAAVVLILIFSVSVSVFYRKKASRFVKYVRMEEQKRRLSHLFRKEVIPTISYGGKPLEDRRKFVIEEMELKKREAQNLIEKAKSFGLDVKSQEEELKKTNASYYAARKLFITSYYNKAVQKSKDTIDGYRFVISDAKGVLKNAYFSLVDEILNELKKPEYLKEKDAAESIKKKINRSLIFEEGGRVIDAYQTILDVKQLLDRLKSKTSFYSEIPFMRRYHAKRKSHEKR